MNARVVLVVAQLTKHCGSLFFAPRARNRAELVHALFYILVDVNMVNRFALQELCVL